MGVLNRQEIERRLHDGELLHHPRRREDGQFDIESDSYDLSAGTAIWKQSTDNGKKGTVETQRYFLEPSGVGQPTVTVQPGQMIFVVTHEDVVMPPGLCGTVYSRNSLALTGILALNAGHVDSGYEGPIVIRLINLRAIPWTLTLGDPIFTIIFQTVDANADDPPSDNRSVSQEDMILRVRETANAALSNALYDLYAVDVEQRLNQYRIDALDGVRKEMDDRWVKRETIWSVLLSSWWQKVLAAIIFLSTVAAGVGAIVYVIQFLGNKLSG